MADDVAALVVQLSASLTKFKDDMGTAVAEAGKAVASIESSFAAANPDASGMIEKFRASAEGPALAAGTSIGLILAGGIAAAAAGIATKLFSTIDALSQLGDRSDDLRLPVNLLQALSVAAGEARVPVKSLNAALDEFTKVTKQDTNDAEKFYKALGNIGQGFVTAFKNAETQPGKLLVLSDALHSTTDEVKKAQLGIQGLGTDNERLIGLFDKGREGIEGYVAQVRKLGLEVNDSLVKQAQEAKSQISLLSRVMTDEFSTGIAELIPLLVSLLPYIERLGAVVRDTLGAFTSRDDQKPLGTLRLELDVLQKDIEKFEEMRDRLVKNEPSEADSLRDQLRKIIGDATGTDLIENIADLDKQIDAAKKRKAEIDALIEGRNKPTNLGTVRPAFKPRPSLKDDDEEKNAFDKAVDSINRHIAALTADAAAVGLNKSAHEQLRVELRLLEAARQSDVKITDEQIAEYGRLRATMGAQQALAAAGIKLTDEQATTFIRLSGAVRATSEVLERNRLAFAAVNEAARYAGNQFVDIIDRATQKGAKFGDIMADVLRNLSRQLLQAAITGEGAFAKLLGTSSSTPGGTGGIFGALLGAFGGSGSSAGGPIAASLASGGSNAGFAIGGLAGGGTIPPGGVAYVGEHGPNPRMIRAGNKPIMVTPDDLSRSGNAGGAISLSMPIAVDARGAQAGVAEQIEAALRRVPMIAIKTIQDAKSRGQRGV